MKFNCGPSPETKRMRREYAAHAEHLRLTNWHSFFTLWPRRVGENDCRWLERIERRGKVVRKLSVLPYDGLAYYSTYAWEYRAK